MTAVVLFVCFVSLRIAELPWRGFGNVYIADMFNNAIEEWSGAAHRVTTLVPGPALPSGVAVDGSGNLYIADMVIQEWSASTQQLTTLVPTVGPSILVGTAVDGSGNVYGADFGNGAVREWIARNPAALVRSCPRG